MLGLNNDEPQEIVENFVNTFGLTFPILLDAGETYGPDDHRPHQFGLWFGGRWDH